MFKEERCNEILKLLQEHGFLTVDAICRALDYSPATIRRDLTYMHQKELIEKSYGGVSLLTYQKKVARLYELREHEFLPEKRKIAERASSLIEDGQIIFIDASSTCVQLLDYLEDKHNITVITNSLAVSSELRKRNINGYCTGGAINSVTPALVGIKACDMISGINIDIAFISTTSLSKSGMITEYDEDLKELLGAVMRNSEKTVYLTYSKRIGTTSMFNICHISEVDYVVSECDISGSFITDSGDTKFIF